MSARRHSCRITSLDVGRAWTEICSRPCSPVRDPARPDWLTAEAAKRTWSCCWCYSSIPICFSIFSPVLPHFCLFQHPCPHRPQAPRGTWQWPVLQLVLGVKGATDPGGGRKGTYAILSTIKISLKKKKEWKKIKELLTLTLSEGYSPVPKFSEPVYSNDVKNCISSMETCNRREHVHALLSSICLTSEIIQIGNIFFAAAEDGRGRIPCFQSCHSYLQWAPVLREHQGSHVYVSICFYYPENTLFDSEEEDSPDMFLPCTPRTHS